MESDPGKKEKGQNDLAVFFQVVCSCYFIAGTGRGYFIFNQKKMLLEWISKINQTPVSTDTTKAGVSDLPYAQDQTQPPQIRGTYKKTNQKEKARIHYSDNFDQEKSTTQDNSASSKTENGSKTNLVRSDSVAAKENKPEEKKDSLGKRLNVKSSAVDSSMSKDLKKPETKNKSNSRKWWLDLYASPDYPIVSPHEYEQSKLSYTLGVRLNRSPGQHFSLKTGIQYSRVNVAGNSLFVHLLRLDLPVLAGYSVGNEKLKTTFNGGAILNLYSWLPGNNSSGFFKRNTGLSLYVGVNFETKINEKFSLFGEPYYRYQLTSMTVSSVAIVKFIDIIGINIGARYYFGNKRAGQ